MPRTSAVELPGCPPLRALTTDVLGLIKVVEAQRKSAVPKVVMRWGVPDTSTSMLAADYADRETDPLLVVARKNGLMEFINPLNGMSLVTTSAHESDDSNAPLEDDPIVGLHLLNTKGPNISFKSCRLLSCTEKGKVSLRAISINDTSLDSLDARSSSCWKVCSSGKVICSSLAGDENHAVFGGKGIEVNVWNFESSSRVWTAKFPHRDKLGIFTPTWFTATTFLRKDDHRKIVAGTNEHQVRLYDISAQRRPVLSINFRETQIKAVKEDLDGHTIYVGNGSGDLASFDIRTGKMLGCFLGKCSGSIRSIARHPKLPVIASCGLDCYLRFWDTRTRQLLSAVFLKQHLTNVFIDSNFSAEAFVPASDVRNNGYSKFAIEGTDISNGERKAKRKKFEDEASPIIDDFDHEDNSDDSGRVDDTKAPTSRGKKQTKGERAGSKQV